MITKENKSDIIISSLLGLLYSILFSVFYLGLGKDSLLMISIYALLSVTISAYIASDLESKEENNFTFNLIKKLVYGFIIGWVLWPGFGELIGP